jgi:hypothetical protein
MLNWCYCLLSCRLSASMNRHFPAVDWRAVVHRPRCPSTGGLVASSPCSSRRYSDSRLALWWSSVPWWKFRHCPKCRLSLPSCRNFNCSCSASCPEADCAGWHSSVLQLVESHVLAEIRISRTFRAPRAGRQFVLLPPLPLTRLLLLGSISKVVAPTAQSCENEVLPEGILRVVRGESNDSPDGTGLTLRLHRYIRLVSKIGLVNPLLFSMTLNTLN